ncbi:ammonium transporter [Zhongshania guokunii]|uniref:Ammonium transporter n=1 Tax=Zhongshania guokunii TaxID=641783 RepID=A0ABV3U2W1_9GAMM
MLNIWNEGVSLSGKDHIDILWLLVAAGMVLLMQAAFLCVESGLTRTKNAINVAMKNVVDFVVAVILFWVLGFGIMFGESVNGWFGFSNFLSGSSGFDPWEAVFFLFQAMFCATAATIVSGAVAERTRFDTYIFLTVLASAVIYPLFGHWAWGGVLVGAPGWLAASGFVDFAGSTVVHSVGGWIALAAVLLIGPRRGRFVDGKPQQMPASNLPLCMLGLVLFIFGWIGFNGGSTLGMSMAIPGIVMNTILAACVGSITAAMLRTRLSPDTDGPTALINGALAGLVAITASCHAVHAGQAAMIGMGGAVVMLLGERLLLKNQIDDPIGAIPVHLFAGIWGTVAVALFGDLEILGTGLSRMAQLQVQLEGIVSCGLLAFVLTYCALKIRARRRPLRVSAEAEDIGLNVAEHGARTPMLDLLDAMELQRTSGDLSARVPVEPFTEVGQIAGRYNRVMEALESANEKTRQVLRDIRDGIITFTREGVLTSLNPGAEKLLGQEGRYAIGKSLVGVLENAGFTTESEFVETLCQRRLNPARSNAKGFDLEPVMREATRLSEGRSELVLEFTSFNTRIDGNDAPDTFTALIRDISERRGFEDQLFGEKEMAQVTLESLGEGVITTDPDGEVTYLNAVAQKIIGLAKTDALPKRLADCFECIDEQSGEPIEVGRLSRTHLRVERHNALTLRRKKDGTEVTVKCTSSPIRNRHFEPVGTVIVFQDVSQERELEQKLSYQAAHDVVTGLINRREFEHRLREALHLAKIDDSCHVLCYIDLDQFKIVNDTCGHHAGDELLRQLGNVFTESVRGSDTVGRLGGDEFGVIFGNCSLEQGAVLAENIRAEIERYRFKWGEGIFSVGGSLGVVAITKEVESAEEVMGMADTACFMAKDGGRNRVHIHQHDDAEILARRGEMHWAARIQQAIDEDRLRLYYQSIVPADKATQAAVAHYEIFVRMLDENNEIVSPGSFIPAAERYDLMVAIDRWVVRNTLAFIGSKPCEPACYAINLSGSSITNADFLAEIKACITRYKVKPEWVCFEITETAAIADLAKARVFITELKEMGCQFALDDFGSGLSSFGYLKSLPVDYLKIDGIFVRDILNDPIDKALVETINNVGHLMNLTTIAEFVESKEIMDTLADIGVDLVQGYHIDKPKPITELRARSTWPR